MRKPQPDALLAHELSQPLGTSLADAQSARRLLRQRVPDREQLKAIVTDIIAEDRRATQLVNHVRLLANRKKGTPHLLDINQSVREIIGMLHDRFSISAVRISTALASELPPVRGDRLQLHQLFINLFLNACEALNQSAASSKRIFIRTYLEKESFVSIDVRDTGPGIPPGQLNAIFKPFVSTKPQGIGIGLHVCRSIVESHHGRLWATNHPGGGATFHVRLPAANQSGTRGEK